jgi:hypothetical protein
MRWIRDLNPRLRLDSRRSTNYAQNMSYQRAQIILSLWAAFAPKSWSAAMPLKSVPKVFVRRVRNLLDRGVGITAVRRAGQKGVFQEYEVEDAVELGIGLSLQNVGMPQSELVAFLLGFQDGIRTHIRSMPTSSVGAEFPHFLIVTPHALNETIRQFGPKPKLEAGGLAFFKPKFVGTKAEWVSIAVGWRSAASIVVEIGDLASSLHATLPESAALQRGRR